MSSPAAPSSSVLPVSNRLVIDLGAIQDNFRPPGRPGHLRRNAQAW